MAKQSRLTGALSVTLAQAIVLAFGYVTHFWVGRALGPGSYGIFGVALSLQTIVGLAQTQGVPMAVSRFVAQDEKHAQSILRQSLQVQFIVSICISVITLLLAPLLAYFLGDASLVSYIRFVALVLFLQSFFPVFPQFLAGLHRFNQQAVLTTVYALAKVVGSIGLLYIWHIYGALAGFAVGGVVGGLLGWYWSRRVGTSAWRKLALKQFLTFAGVYFLILVGLQILISLDLFMVKAIMKDNVQAGYYNAAVTLSRIPYSLLQALAFILLPSVSALTKPGASHDAAAKFIRDTLRYLIALIVPGVALAASTSQGLIRLFFSGKFDPAAPVLTILMIGLGSLAFYLLLANIVAGAGRPQAGLVITIGMLCISAVAGVVLIPHYRLIGAAWQTTIAGVFGLVLLSAYTFYTFKIPLPIRSSSNILIASAAACATTYVWPHLTLLLPVEYVLALIVYLATLFVLKEITAEDRRRLASIHPKLKWLAYE